MLVFWETTRACGLACRHCRASATPSALPGELTTAQGLALIEEVASFGKPSPVLVLTGGDCLLRPDLFELVERARSLGIPTALSPSVTPLLTPAAIERIAASGVRAVSISLDGATAATHDGVRGVAGHFEDTLQAIRRFVEAGLTVQINTTVMRVNVEELPDVAAILAETGAHIWEVFFLVHVGRGVATGALSPAEHEDVCHLLYDAAHHGFVVRTVEAPFFRRVVAQRRGDGDRPQDAPPETALYRRLRARLDEALGPPTARPAAHTAATRDGKGIVFVAHDGEVYPAGFLPLGLGRVTERSLRDIYVDDERFRALRAADFRGRCGRCEYADLCGGSRARAYAASGDLLGEDPACAYRPAETLA
ncbi:MAG: TIGR04053 family radical SAM/SPASM domain-containing protein [Actinomycetales bacterium]|nr:TIGR04053 family radical SAM/SPASM domain-containing protein [Actinomycetales bacterium]